MDVLKWCQDVMDELYFPSQLPKEKMEPVERVHFLATFGVSMIDHIVNLCDDDGYDIIPLQIIWVIINNEKTI